MKKICTTIISLMFFGSLVFTQLAEFSHNLNRRISKMKKLLTIIVSLMFFGNLVFAQLTEFSHGDILSAGAMNNNFKYLEKRFGGIRETTVNCGTSGTGSGINSAIQNGYNSIVINGICKENIKLVGTEGNTSLLKLRGANNDASQDKIIDNSSYTEHVLKFNYGDMLVTIDNLTISGGDRAITAWSNINLRIYNSKVEGYKNRGINLAGGSVLDAENLTIDGSYSGATTDEEGLFLWGGSVAWFNNLTITNNQKYGLTMYLSDIGVEGNVTLTGNSRAINVGKGATFNSNANITISGSTDKAISVSQGLLEIWDGTTSITSTTGQILSSWMSNIQIKNLTATGDGSSGHIFSINNSVFSLENLSLSNGGEHGIWIGNSTGEIDNLTSSNNKESGIVANRSRIRVENSVFSDNDNDGIKLDQASSLELRSSTISSNVDEGIEVEGGSYIKVRDSTISNNDDDAIQIDEGSVLDVKDSTITGKSGKNAISGFNKSIMILSEDDGSTVISTTNSDAIYLRNSHGEIRDGVVVSATGTNYASGIELWGSSINIEEGATVSGTQDGGSVMGHMYSTIEISHGSTVSLPVWCGNDNTTTVALMSSGSNYSSATIGNNCKTLRF